MELMDGRKCLAWEYSPTFSYMYAIRKKYSSRDNNRSFFTSLLSLLDCVIVNKSFL